MPEIIRLIKNFVQDYIGW